MSHIRYVLFESVAVTEVYYDAICVLVEIIYTECSCSRQLEKIHCKELSRHRNCLQNSRTFCEKSSFSVSKTFLYFLGVLIIWVESN